MPGRIYVAPPDYHLLVQDDRVRLTRGPRENGHRPSVDTLFRSAARAHGPRVVGVVLSGTLDDGTEGLNAIKRHGGTAIVQQPSTALFSDMPRNALENAPVDYCLPVPEIARTLVQLAQTATAATPAVPPSGVEGLEAQMAELDPPALQCHDRPGVPSGFVCPECSGALWELESEGLPRFRCRVGHAYGAESLVAEQSLALESALWTALRALEEQAALAHRLLERAHERGRMLSVMRFQEQEQEAQAHAELIRRVLLATRRAHTGDPPDEAPESDDDELLDT